MPKPVYFNFCPTCRAEPRKPCRTLTTGRVTDTHAHRMHTVRLVHSPEKCEGEGCPMHHPSDHHMVDWPMLTRYDRVPPLIERACTHGVGHPDPDSASWAQRAVVEESYVWQSEISDGSFVWVHGCDGCCRA